MELNAMQRAAILTALKKAVEEALKDVRKDADAEIMDLYEGFGTDRVQIKVNDIEIGTLSIPFSDEVYEITDRAEFEDFCLANGLADIKRSIRPEFMHEAVRRIQEETPGAIQEETVFAKDISKYLARYGDGFVIEGTTQEVPGIVPVPKKPKKPTLRGCNPDVVLPAVNALPGGINSLLLGGGQDE